VENPANDRNQPFQTLILQFLTICIETGKRFLFPLSASGFTSLDGSPWTRFCVTDCR